MSFLVLLLVLVIEKFSALRSRIQDDRFLLRELRRLETGPRLVSQPWLVLTLWVLLPCVLLALLLFVLKPVAYGLLALPVHLLVLVYSLGRGDLRGSLGPFRDAWRREDTQGALHVAQRDLDLTAEGGPQLLQRVQAHFVWDAYQGFFAVIFWYVLLGPVAALAYRLLALAQIHSQNPGVTERAAQIQHAFDFLPVRLLAMSFALVGNFVAVSRVMLHELLNWYLSAPDLIDRAGRVAGDFPPPEPGSAGLVALDRIWELLLRSAILWYAVFAAWTLFT